MRHLLNILVGVIVMSLHGAMALGATITSNVSGDWSAPGTWVGGVVPSYGDTVIIANGTTVTLDQNATVASLTVGGGVSGGFQYENTTSVRKLTITGDLIINSGAVFTLGAQDVNVEHLLDLAGNVSIGDGGRLDIGGTSTKGVITNFNKSVSGDQTISSSGTPAGVSIGKVQLNRPTSTDRVVCSVSLESSGGTLAMQLMDGTWEQTAGTWSGPAFFASDLQLDWSSGNIVLSGTGSMILTGSAIFAGGITVNTTGSLTTGSLNSNSRLQPNSTGILTVQNGTVNVRGGLTISGAANISGGTIDIHTQGVGLPLSYTSNAFEVASTGNFTMSGGTITVVDPIQTSGSGLEVKLSAAATYSITGGKLRIGDGVSTAAGAEGFQVSAYTVPLWNLELNGDDTYSSRMVTLEDNGAQRNLVVRNNLVINSGTLDARNFDGTGSDFTIGGSFVNNGTLNLGTASTITLNGTTPQTTGAAFPSSMPNLRLNNSAGVTFTNPITVAGMLTLGGNGSYSNLSNVTGNTGVTYAATVAQTTGLELSPGMSVLIINNANGVTLSSSTSVGTLTLTSGIVTTGVNTLRAGTISGASSSSYIDGKLARAFSGREVKVFPIGAGGNYRPLTVDYTLSSGSFGTVTAQQFETPLIGHLPPGTTLYTARHWTLTESGGSGSPCNLTLDGTGFTPTAIPVVLKDEGGTLVSYTGYTATGLTSFGDFGLGDYTPPPSMQVDAKMTPFASVAGVPSAEQSYLVGGAYLIDNITITPPADFELSLTSGSGFGTSPITLTPSGGMVNQTTIYVRMNRATGGTSSGNIVHTSAGVPTQDVPVSGTASGLTVVGVALDASWNLISNPVTDPVPGDSVRQLYPTSLNAYAFEYSGGYVQQYRLANGKGYWGKFPAAISNSVTGTARTRDSISVLAGWNIVGTISNTVDTSTIVSVPPGLRASNWFGYQGGYVAVTQLVPGKGYWLKSNGAGKFVLANPLGKAQASVSAPALAEELNTLTITDTRGGSQTLYFGADGAGQIPVAMYGMPPLPPAGAFDARFETAEGGSMVRTHQANGSGEFTVSIQSDAYPLTLAWNVGKGTESYELTDGRGGKEFRPMEMAGEGSIKLTNGELSRITVRLMGDGQVPTEFALSQNFPNPFNPTTLISYQLPVSSNVRLVVYDLLGREVSALVNEEQKAGYKSVEWNAANFASGVYFYRLTAGNFVQARKLLLLK